MTKNEKLRLARVLAQCYLAAPHGEIEDLISKAMDLLVGEKTGRDLVATVPDNLACPHCDRNVGARQKDKVPT